MKKRLSLLKAILWMFFIAGFGVSYAENKELQII